MSNNPEKVIMYKTTDGKLHESLEDAKIHENRAKVEKYATPFLVSVGARKYSDVLFETILESSSDIQRLAAVLASITGEVSEPKRRGRPKSAIIVVDEAGEPVAKTAPRVVNTLNGDQPAKRRGRPPKVKVELVEGMEVNPTPKRRGRPPKAVTTSDALGPICDVIRDPIPPVAAKRRGRPPKSSTTTVTTQTLPPPPEVITVHTPVHTPPNIPASFAPPMPPMTPPPPFPPGAPSFPLA